MKERHAPIERSPEQPQRMIPIQPLIVLGGIPAGPASSPFVEAVMKGWRFKGNLPGDPPPSSGAP